MPPRRRKVFGSCLFCHQEYQILHYGPPRQRRVSWCQCAGARAEQKRRKNEANRVYWLKCRAERGKEPQVRRVRGPGYRSKNRFYCHTCWVKIESWIDVDMAVDVGESRRMGVRA